jgi:hypothetical protein
MLKLYEYAVIQQPKLDKDGHEIESGKVIVEPTSELAKDEQQATLLAARAIPDEFIEDLDRITLVVRPF